MQPLCPSCLGQIFKPSKKHLALCYAFRQASLAEWRGLCELSPGPCRQRLPISQKGKPGLRSHKSFTSQPPHLFCLSPSLISNPMTLPMVSSHFLVTQRAVLLHSAAQGPVIRATALPGRRANVLLWEVRRDPVQSIQPPLPLPLMQWAPAQMPNPNCLPMEDWYSEKIIFNHIQIVIKNKKIAWN